MATPIASRSARFASTYITRAVIYGAQARRYRFVAKNNLAVTSYVNTFLAEKMKYGSYEGTRDEKEQNPNKKAATQQDERTAARAVTRSTIAP